MSYFAVSLLLFGSVAFAGVGKCVTHLTAGDELRLPVDVSIYYPMYAGDLDTWTFNGVPIRVGMFDEAYRIPFDPQQILPGGGATASDPWYFVRTVGNANGLRTRTLDVLSFDSPLFREVTEATDFSLKRLVATGSMSADQVEAVKRDRQLLPIDRTIYFVYRDPRDAKVVAVMGVVDGSQYPGVYAGFWTPEYCYPFPGTRPKSPPAIQLERKFPHVKLDERAEGQRQDVYELVRLSVDEEVSDGLPSLLTAAATFMYTKHGMPGGLPRRGVVYATIPDRRAHQRLYGGRYHFEERYSPEELRATAPGGRLRGMRRDLAAFCTDAFGNPHEPPALRVSPSPPADPPPAKP